MACWFFFQSKKKPNDFYDWGIECLVKEAVNNEDWMIPQNSINKILKKKEKNEFM